MAASRILYELLFLKRSELLKYIIPERIMIRVKLKRPWKKVL